MGTPQTAPPGIVASDPVGASGFKLGRPCIGSLYCSIFAVGRGGSDRTGIALRRIPNAEEAEEGITAISLSSVTFLTENRQRLFQRKAFRRRFRQI
jgi:hypothetical protein